jgi:S1-C subfamily serine protease
MTALLVAGVACLSLLAGYALQRSNVFEATSRLESTPALASSTAVAATVAPALVDITATLTYSSRTVSGTGIVLSPDGLVLTNNHVIDGATTISATDVGNGQQYAATVLGYDRSADVALLQLEGASGLAVAELGDSAQIAVGEPVVGVGNAGGVGGTPSAATGAVLALDQRIEATNVYDHTFEQLGGLIATDAAIRPGDSGGPLANAAGQVIGIDTAASDSYLLGAATGRGYAIPIDVAMALAGRIEDGQGSAAIHLGPTAFLGIGIAASSSRGVSVAQVFYGTPAAQAGLASGDVIVDLAGQAVASPTALSTLLVRHHPGDGVTITWRDQSGTLHTGSVQLAAGPAA